MTNKDEVISWIRQWMSRILKVNGNTVPLNKPLIEQGLDSLAINQLFLDLSKQYKTDLDPTLLFDAPQLGSLAERIAAVINEGKPAIEPKQTKHSTSSPIEQLKKSPSFALWSQQMQFVDELKQKGFKNVYHRVFSNADNKMIREGNKEYINYLDYNYVGLAHHPEIKRQAIAAIEKNGTSASSSRIISGTRQIHLDLEKAIADFLEVDDSLVYTAGFMTNETTISHLMGQKDLIVFDSLCHRSIIAGCEGSSARKIPFPHNDFKALDAILTDFRDKYEKALIIIEGLYSTDGDIPDLPQIIEIKKKHQCLLMIDEAHSIGTIGKTGRGIGEYHNINRNDVDIWMGTLSKSLASCGGFIAGNRNLISFLKYTSPGYVFSAAISPANTAAAFAAINLLNQEPERVKALSQRCELFLKLCKERGINTGVSKDSPIIPVIVGSSTRALLLSNALFEKGIGAIPMIYPSVEEGKSRLRFFITSEHTDEQIRKTIPILADELNKIMAMPELKELATSLRH